MQGLRKIIHQLRQEPQHVRLRAVSIATGVSGILLFAVWGLVLLPLQLNFSRSSNDNNQPDDLGQVSGVINNVTETQKIATPSPQIRVNQQLPTNNLLESPTPIISEFISPTPSITSLQENQESSENSTDDKSIPVDITEDN